MLLGRITFFALLFFLGGMALLDYFFPLAPLSKSVTSPSKNEGIKAIEIQNILLAQFSFNEVDWKSFFSQLEQKSFPFEWRLLLEQKKISLSQELYLKAGEPNKWFMEDVGNKKQYLLQKEGNSFLFFYLPISASLKEPYGTVFCALDVELEQKSGTFEGSLNLEHPRNSYHYRQPIYLQNEAKKKQTFLIEHAKNEYYSSSSDLELNLSLEHQGKYAPLPYKRKFFSPSPADHLEQVLIISKDFISFGLANPFYQVTPKDLESTLVRLLEFDLIVLYDRTLPYLNTSQFELLLDYVRYGGKLFLCEEKINKIPILSEALSKHSWETTTMDHFPYQYLYYYQGVVAKLTHPQIYQMDFRMKFKETYNRHEVPDYKLFKEVLFFPTLPPILGPYTFSSRTAFDKYFHSSWIGVVFFLLLFLCCGPGFLLFFRKYRGFKLLYIQGGLLIGFSILSLFFTQLLTSQIGFIDTFSFYYLNEKEQGYLINYHLMGGSQTKEAPLVVSSKDPFYLLRPLGENFPEISSYSATSTVNQYAYSKKWEEPHFIQKLWKAFPMNTTQPIQKEGFVIEGGFLKNKTPFPFREIWVFEVENKHTTPYSNKARQIYNRGSSASSGVFVKEQQLAAHNYYYEKEQKDPYIERSFDLRSLTLSVMGGNLRIFRSLHYYNNKFVDWYPKFREDQTLFAGLPDGFYVLAYGGFDQPDLLDNQEIQIHSPLLKQSSRTVVWLQRLADKAP